MITYLSQRFRHCPENFDHYTRYRKFFKNPRILSNDLIIFHEISKISIIAEAQLMNFISLIAKLVIKLIGNEKVKSEFSVKKVFEALKRQTH